MAKLFVGNLSWEATDQDIREFFEEGRVTPTEIVIIYDKDSGKSRGFAFVTVDDIQADAALQLDNQIMLGRQVHVNEARERTQRSAGYGGRR